MPEAKRRTAENVNFQKRLKGTQKKEGDKTIQCEIKTKTTQKQMKVMRSHLLAVLPNIDANTQHVNYVRGAPSEKDVSVNS